MLNAKMAENTKVSNSDAGNRIIRTFLVLLMVIGIATNGSQPGPVASD